MYIYTLNFMLYIKFTCLTITLSKNTNTLIKNYTEDIINAFI